MGLRPPANLASDQESVPRSQTGLVQSLSLVTNIWALSGEAYYYAAVDDRALFAFEHKRRIIINSGRQTR